MTISQEDIDAVLTRGSGVCDGKIRIYAQFVKGATAKENIQFLMNEYGIGGCYPAVAGRPVSEDHDSRGMHIRYGNIITPDCSVRLTWSMVEKRIRELIRNNLCLNAAEK